MAEFEISEADALECKDWVYQQYNAHTSKNGEFKDALLADKATAEKALSVLDEKLESGIITDERYKLRVAIHQQTIEHANNILNSTIRDAERWLELSNETFNSVVNIGEVFEMADGEERRQLMKYLGSNWYLSNKKVELTPRRPLDLLRHNDHDLVWRARPDSNRRSPP